MQCIKVGLRAQGSLEAIHCACSATNVDYLINLATPIVCVPVCKAPVPPNKTPCTHCWADLVAEQATLSISGQAIPGAALSSLTFDFTDTAAVATVVRSGLKPPVLHVPSSPILTDCICCPTCCSPSEL